MMSGDGEAGKYRIDIGSVTHSQVTVGDYNEVSQTVGLSPQEAAELRAVFADLRGAVGEQAPPAQREQALAEAAELESAVVAGQPDANRARKALRWFRDNAPQLVGTVVATLVNPVVGKVVESAGELVAGQFRELAEEER